MHPDLRVSPLWIAINKTMEKEKMTEEPKPAPAPFNIDLNKILPTIANLYKQTSWAIPIIEKFGGFKIPPEIIMGLDALSSGKPLTPEQMQTMKTSIETIQTTQPQIGEPVLTEHLAFDAWEMHYKEGKSFRQIAETLTKEGYPCSHATVARYVEMIDQSRKMSKVLKLIKAVKITSYIVPPLIAFWIGVKLF